MDIKTPPDVDSLQLNITVIDYEKGLLDVELVANGDATSDLVLVDTQFQGCDAVASDIFARQLCDLIRYVGRLR